MFRKSRKTSKAKAANKDQEEFDKPGNLDPKKVLPDITVLINERDFLQDEVKNLREQLENEAVRYKELKSLKHQQVCALTFKLAKAIRDKERALEEKEDVNEKFVHSQNRNEELEVQNEMLRNKLNDKEIEYAKLCSEQESFRVRSGNYPIPDCTEDEQVQSPKKVLPHGKLSCFAITGVIKDSNDENTSKQVDVEEIPKGDGESAQVNQSSKDLEFDSPELTTPKIENDEQREYIIAEFRKIQQEVADVKKNMSIVQALNERLSNDLQILSELKKSRSLSRSELERSRKNGCSDLLDCTDGKPEANIFVFPDVSTENSEDLTTEVVDMVDQTDVEELESTTPAEELQEEEEVIKEEEQEEQEEHEQDEGTKGDDTTETESSETHIKNQLEKAIKELEDIRTDNREMKQQINKMAKSTFDHDDFLRRTTNFTGQMLKEMKQREDERSRKTSTESQISQPPLNVLGTRLDEIMRAVDDMTNDPVPTPQEALCSLAPIPRPRSAETPSGIPSTQSAFTPLVVSKEEDTPLSRSRSHTVPNQKVKGNCIKGKLGELYERDRLTSGVDILYERDRLTSGVDSLRSAIQTKEWKKTKEWKSTEALSPRSTSFSGSVSGYRDYLQRHIVMSSSSIAKIRDLTPDEILIHNGQLRYY